MTTNSSATVQAPVDFTTAEVQQQMDASLSLYASNEYVTPGTLASWWVGFKEFKNATVGQVRTRMALKQVSLSIVNYVMIRRFVH